MEKIIIFMFMLLGFLPCVQAQPVRTDLNGPIHEAFADRVTEETALQAVSTQPPDPIQEQAPRHVDPTTIWIPGYWEWFDDNNNFIWVSGIWRKPPPNMDWIAGDWQNFDEGWARVRGFWSDVLEDELEYIDSAPPDQIDENVSNPPNDTSFWLPGYWSYDTDQDEYNWLGGRWEELDPNWVIVPAHYVWREDGYVFIPPYWDWPLESRGQVYAASHFTFPIRPGIIYEPTIVLTPQLIINALFFDYPDYSCLFYHHYCYHLNFWEHYPYTPPWWGWRTWWTFSWHHCWGLWWWYGHPGYPVPTWITPEVASRLPPPHTDFVAKFKKYKGPPIITPRGVVSPSEYRNALKEVHGKGKFLPVASVNVKTKEKIDAVINKKVTEVKHLEPTGKKTQISPKAQVAKPPIQQPGLKPKTPADKEKERVIPTVKTPVKPVKTQQREPRHPVHEQPQPEREQPIHK